MAEGEAFEPQVPLQAQLGRNLSRRFPTEPQLGQLARNPVLVAQFFQASLTSSIFFRKSSSRTGTMYLGSCHYPCAQSHA